MKSDGAVFKEYLSEALNSMSYKITYADLDVWILTELIPNVFECYEYILCYVDGVIFIPSYIGIYTMSIKYTFKLKDDKIAEPEMYLGLMWSKQLLEDDNMY